MAEDKDKRQFVNPIGRAVAAGVIALGGGTAAGQPVETYHGVVLTVDNPGKAFVDLINKVEGSAKSENVAGAEIRQVKVEGKASHSDDEIIDTYYPNLNEKERGELKMQIGVMKEYMKGILTEQSYANVDSKIDYINTLSNYSGVKPEIFVGLAMAESRGGVDGSEENGSEAMGWVQITRSVAEEYGLNVTGGADDERLVVEKALPVAAIYITRGKEIFGDDGFAAWSWHKGYKGIQTVLENHSAENAESFLNFKDYVKDNKLNVYKVLQSKYLREDLEHPEEDKTTLFVLRQAAGAILYYNPDQR